MELPASDTSSPIALQLECCISGKFVCRAQEIIPHPYCPECKNCICSVVTEVLEVPYIYIIILT
jgi:hypothetical protein